MKKITSFMSVCAILVSGSAGADTVKNISEWHKPETKVCTNLYAENAGTLSGDCKPSFSVIAKNAADITIINEAPEGTVNQYVREGLAYYKSWTSVGLSSYSKTVSEMVECEDGDVYLKMPLSQSRIPSYIVGRKNGNEITFELPQAVAVVNGQDGGETYLYATLAQYYEQEGQASFYAANSSAAKECGLPEISNTLILESDGTGNYVYRSGVPSDSDGNVNLQEGGVMLSMNDEEGNWYGYGEINSSWIPFRSELVCPPENLETEIFEFTYSGPGDSDSQDMGHFVTVGFDASDVYVKGIFQQTPEVWLKGTVNDDNTISFPTEQYLGVNENYGVYTYFFAAEVDKVYLTMRYLDALDFAFDSDTKTLTIDKDKAFIYNSVYYMSMYDCCLLRPQIENPEITLNDIFNMSYDDSWDPGFFSFNYSVLNRDGYMLDTDKMYYRMFVDGEEYTLSPEYYTMLDKELTWIPVDFNDGYDINGYPGVVQINAYLEDFKTVGFQLYYMEEDVETGDFKEIARSEMALYHSAGVGDIIEAGEDDIVSVRYYNIAGQEVGHVSNGLFIRTVEYADGTKNSRKVVLNQN